MRVLTAIIISLAVFCASGATEDGSAWTVAASNDFSLVVIGNSNVHRSGKNVICKWSVLRNGEPYAADSFDLMDVLPGKSRVYAMPVAFRQVRARGEKASLRVRFVGAPDRELARRQLDAPDGVPHAYRPVSGEALEMQEDDQTLRFSSDGLSVTFSKRTGLLAGMRRKGFFTDDVLVAEPMRLVVAEAPKLSFAWMVESLSEVGLQPTQAHFTAFARAVAPEASALLELDWTVFRDGTVRCLCRLRPAVGKSLPADVGLLVPTGATDPEIDYFAVDGLLGRQSAEADALTARRAAIRGARALEVKDGSALLGFAAVGRPFSFTAVAGKTVGIGIYPDGVDDCRRPRHIDFMIGPRRFANVVGAN